MMKSIFKTMGLAAFVIIEALIHVMFGVVVSYAGYVRAGNAIIALVVIALAFVLPFAAWSTQHPEKKLS